ELPEGGSRGCEPDRYCTDDQQNHHDPVAAETVGPEAQRQPEERTRQDGRRSQQAEFGGSKSQLSLDWNADHAKHHPDCKADGEGEGGNEKYRQVSGAGHSCPPPTLTFGCCSQGVHCRYFLRRLTKRAAGSRRSHL